PPHWSSSASFSPWPPDRCSITPPRRRGISMRAPRTSRRSWGRCDETAQVQEDLLGNGLLGGSRLGAALGRLPPGQHLRRRPHRHRGPGGPAPASCPLFGAYPSLLPLQAGRPLLRRSLRGELPARGDSPQPPAPPPGRRDRGPDPQRVRPLPHPHRPDHHAGPGFGGGRSDPIQRHALRPLHRCGLPGRDRGDEAGCARHRGEGDAGNRLRRRARAGGDHPMRTVGLISAGMIAIGAILTIIRVEKGPSSLDRIVALDIISNILIIAVALDAAINLRRETIPILAALALVGFISSVAVARYAAVEPREARRIKTPEEVAAEEEALRREEEAAALAEAEAKAQRDEEIAP